MSQKSIVTWFQTVSVGLLMGGAALLSSGCAGDVAYTAGPAGYYDYDYYPNGDVYFYPEGRVYYWNDGGYWRSGRRLPRHYHLREENREHLRLHTRQPWLEHHEEHQEHERFERRRDRD